MTQFQEFLTDSNIFYLQRSLRLSQWLTGYQINASCFFFLGCLFFVFSQKVLISKCSYRYNCSVGERTCQHVFDQRFKQFSLYEKKSLFPCNAKFLHLNNVWCYLSLYNAMKKSQMRYSLETGCLLHSSLPHFFFHFSPLILNSISVSSSRSSEKATSATTRSLEERSGTGVDTQLYIIIYEHSYIYIYICSALHGSAVL